MAIVQDREIAGLLEEALLPQPVRPKAVLFGDSMSEYVGYNADGTPNTKYGNSIADVIGNNLGISVENLATGGETSNEALAGGSKFGAFADYISQNRPEYAIIRYGAADAIKNQDPNITLQSVQQMVDIARANGVTPIIVGVSELYGAQNSKTGNIAGYIDPGAEQRANAINAGLAQIAANNGLAFTDVRSAVSAGKGDLLDGVHTNADFGKKMADAISESIVEQSAIQGANVPQLPPNVDALSNEEKGRLYNQFIEQGYSDAQIRTAAKAESDQDWNALKQIAASVKNTTPATIERRAALEAASVKEPEIMMAQSAPDSGAGAMTQGLLQPTQASVSPPQIAGQAASMVAPSLLSAQEAAELREAQAMGGAGFGRPTDIVATSNLAPVDIAYLAQGKGMFGNPLLGYDPTSPLQWALQSGIGVPATQFLTQAGMNLLGMTDASAIAQDASQLAGQGLSESQIISTLKASGVPTSAAVSAAEGAISGSSVFSIAQDIADTAYRAATVAPSVSPVVSEVAAQSVPVTGGLLSGGIADVVSTLPSVQVTGATQQPSTPTAPVVPVQQALTTTQQVQIQNQVDPDTASQIISIVTGAPVSVAGSAQQVQVSGQPTREISQSDAAQVLSSIVGQQVNVTAPRVQETATDATTAVSSLLAPTQAVSVTTPPETTADATTTVSSLFAPTQTVPVTAPPAQTRPTDAASLLNVIPTQTVPVTAPTVPSSQVPSIVSADTGGLLAPTFEPTQQVQIQNQVDPDTASQIISTITGTPVAVAGSQQVEVAGRPTQQISQETAAQVLSAITNQQVNVGTSRVQETPSDVLTNLLAPTETVPVTSAVERQPAQDTAAAVTSGLLATESVPVQSQRLTTDDASQIISALAGQPVVVADQSVPVTSTAQRVTPQDAASIISSVIGQQVTVTSQPVREDVTPVTQMIPTAATQQVQVTAPEPKPSDLITPASVIPAVIPAVVQPPVSEQVTIEDRYIPPPAPAPIITAPPGPPPAPIQTPRGEIPVEDRIIPREQFQPITGSVPLTGLGLGLALPVAAAGASLLAQNQDGSTFDQAYTDAILNAPRPVYGGQQFAPLQNYFQIAPTNVYNPFATVAPFGAGRFGAINQPFALPRGLI